MVELLVYGPDRPHFDERYVLDTARMAALGWSQDVTWEDGLRRTLEWYEEHIGNWVTPIAIGAYPSLSTSAGGVINPRYSSARRKSRSVSSSEDVEYTPRNILVTGGAGFM